MDPGLTYIVGKSGTFKIKSHEGGSLSGERSFHHSLQGYTDFVQSKAGLCLDSTFVDTM